MVTSDDLDKIRLIVREELAAALQPAARGPSGSRRPAGLDAPKWLAAGIAGAVKGRGTTTTGEALEVMGIPEGERARLASSVGAILLSLGWAHGGRRGGRKARERFYVAPSGGVGTAG